MHSSNTRNIKQFRIFGKLYDIMRLILFKFYINYLSFFHQNGGVDSGLQRACSRSTFISSTFSPVIRQAEAAECGLACIGMIAGYHGLDTDMTTLRRRFGLSKKLAMQLREAVPDWICLTRNLMRRRLVRTPLTMRRVRTVHAAEAKAWAETQAEAVSNKNAISLAWVSNIGNPSHISSFTERKNAMNRIVQLHDYLFKKNDKHFTRSLLIAIVIIASWFMIAFSKEMLRYIGGDDFEVDPVEEKWGISYFTFISVVIIVPLIENLFIVMIFKISELFFENKEIIPLTIVSVIMEFQHTFFLPAFVAFFIMSYQYVMYRKNLTKFHAYMCTVATHGAVNCFVFLFKWMV